MKKGRIHNQTLLVRFWEWKAGGTLRELKVKWSFKTRTTNGNEGRGAEEVTVNSKSHLMKQILSIQHLSVIFH